MQPRLLRIGCVSYLNAKPLIDGLQTSDGVDAAVRLDVPAGLLDDLQSGAVDVALCPVADYFRSSIPLSILPVGGIGCDGPTLTVRLYSAVPIVKITTVHADTDSHTSVNLLKVLLRRRYDIAPRFIAYDPRAAGSAPPPSMLLIGDKVITAAPSATAYPHQLDLGEAWHAWTGLPFVFAVWMTRRGESLGDLPARLYACRRRNTDRIGAIADQYAPRLGWPADLARHYLGDLLRYEIGPRQLDAIARFGEELAALGLADRRPLDLYP